MRLSLSLSLCVCVCVLLRLCCCNVLNPFVSNSNIGIIIIIIIGINIGEVVRKGTLVEEKQWREETEGRGRREEEETVRTLAWIPLRRLLSPRSLRPHGIIHSPIEKGTDSHSHPHSA